MLLGSPAKKPTVAAYLVAYIDASADPPSICEAGIFSEPWPTKASRHEGRCQILLLTKSGETVNDAADEIKRQLAGPDWRWIYKVPVLTAGFVHEWADGKCLRCGIPKDSPARTAGGRPPDRCLVSHMGVCSSCGHRRPILQGDALCTTCRYPPARP